MPTIENAETSERTAGAATVIDRVADAVRHAAHVSHKARLASSIAKDTGEEAVYAAKRFAKRIRRGADTLNDVKDDAMYYVKQRPFASVGMAAGTGLLVGFAAGWIGSRLVARRRNDGGADDWTEEVGQ